MKKILMAVFFAVVLAFGGSALALTINEGGINVGDVDTVHDSTYIFEPNDDNELAWIQEVLGNDYYISDAISVKEGDWTQTDQNSDAYAYYLGGELDYFYIWLATNPKNPPDANAFLFKNEISLEWAVIQLSDLVGYTPPGGDINIGRVSHLREIGGTPVPEPGMVILLGIGLLGLAFYNRKRLLN